MPLVQGRRERRTRRRLARVRLANPKALPGVTSQDGYTVREARKVKRVDRRMRARDRAKQQAKRQASGGFDPLAPLTGRAFDRESQAAERLQFGEKERALREELSRRDQAATNTASYYDEWKQALRESSDRIGEANRKNVEGTEGRVSAAYEQDSAAVRARDAAASEQAAKLGRGAIQSEEGARAVEAQRSQGNQGVAELRTRAASDTKLAENRAATAVLSKAQALARESSKRAAVEREQKDLAGDKGAFRVDFRNRARKGEREWAAIQKEFGLKQQDMVLRHGANREDRAIERQKVAAQKIVARIYASADRAGARAQIRIARINLEKGKITQSQFRTIKNIYEGLPEKGQSPGAADPNKKPLTGSEEKTVKGAFDRLKKAGARADQRKAAIDQLIGKYGYPPRIAREAWNRYARRAPGSNYDKGNNPG